MNTERIQGKHGGFSLLEVVIAIVVVAVGVLGISSAQLISLKNNQSAYYRSQANFIAMDMLDRMRANPDGVQAGHYAHIDTDGITPSASPPACSQADTGCSVTAIAAADKVQWANYFSTGNNVGLLPGSRGTVDTTVNGSVATTTVTVTWTENAWDEDPNGDGDNEDAGFADSTGRVSLTVRL